MDTPISESEALLLDALRALGLKEVECLRLRSQVQTLKLALAARTDEKGST